MAKAGTCAHVYVVQGEHPFVPGRPMQGFLIREDAQREALKLANIIFKDLSQPEAKTWREADRRLKAAVEVIEDENDESYDVWITRLAIK